MTTEVNITLESEVSPLGVFLHHPSEVAPDPLLGASHTVIRNLDDGLYHVSVSGSALAPDKVVSVTFATDAGSKKRGRKIKPDGTIGAMIAFLLENGDVK